MSSIQTIGNAWAAALSWDPFIIHKGGNMRTYRILGIIGIILLTVTFNAWAKNSSGRIVMTVDLSDHGSDGVAQVWIPYPVSNSSQTVTNIQVEGSMSSSRVYTETAFSTPMLLQNGRKTSKTGTRPSPLMSSGRKWSEKIWRQGKRPGILRIILPILPKPGSARLTGR